MELFEPKLYQVQHPAQRHFSTDRGWDQNTHLLTNTHVISITQDEINTNLLLMEALTSRHMTSSNSTIICKLKSTCMTISENKML